jgi:hypothetical protein
VSLSRRCRSSCQTTSRCVQLCCMFYYKDACAQVAARVQHHMWSWHYSIHYLDVRTCRTSTGCRGSLLILIVVLEYRSGLCYSAAHSLQTAEYLLEHGLLDLVVPRSFLKVHPASCASGRAQQAQQERMIHVGHGTGHMHAEQLLCTQPNSPTDCRLVRVPCNQP